MEESKLNDLLERYRDGKATPEDEAFLESWYLEHNGSMPFLMSDEEKKNDVDKVWSHISDFHTPAKKHFLWYRLAAAASIVTFLLLGSYFLTQQKKQVRIAIIKNDIAPGKNKATLTLANGKKVILSEAVNGQLANQSGVTVSKTKTGELVYTVHSSKKKDQKLSAFNTLATANGEQYHVMLPDGTNVWLNAASTLTYPVAFAGNERLVELSGEAYFEVTHNKDIPFKVKTAHQEIQVLGTHFNVNAYTDEKATTTTLLQGSVKVSSAVSHKSLVIKPGQQSIVDNAELNVQDADTDEAIAWKNGYFNFNNENLESIMKQVSRWYNVEINYQNNTLPALVFSGTVSKYKNVSQIIKVLELTNAAHFKIDNNKITVTP